MLRFAVRRAISSDFGLYLPPSFSSSSCRPTFAASIHHHNYHQLCQSRNDFDLTPENNCQTPAVTELSTVRRSFHSDHRSRGWFSPKDDVTLLGRTLYKLGFTEIPKSILMQFGYRIYMKIADELDYLKFFEHCNLPDTYASWFIVVELHVWLISARLMQNGKEGRIVRNALIKAMWDDNDVKIKKLEGALPAASKREMKKLNEQFYAAIIGYDEGLLADDYVLAGALWRRFLRPSHDSDVISLQPQDFETSKHEKLAERVKALEMLVIYVRSQFYMLNNLSREQLLKKRAIKFAPFDDSLFELSRKLEKFSSRPKVEAVKMR